MTTPTREQVIEQAIQGHASTRMAMQWLYEHALKEGRDQGIREAKEANADEWQSAMFTLHGYAQGLLMDDQQDMPLYFMKLAELIAKTHVDDAHAERMAQLRAAAIEQLRGK